jgi:P-type Ca2+ transporter type 2C
MAFNAFVAFQFFNILNVRSDQLTVFRRTTLTNHKLWITLGAVVVLQVAVTHLGPLQRLFDTTSITAGQWLVCLTVASSVLWIEEIRKLTRRRSAR